MVELMNNDEAVAATAAYRGKKPAVKAETDDPLEAHAPLRKRSKSSTHGQQSKGIIGGSYSGLVQLQYNPLEEPSPLGLQLRKSPSLLDLIQMTLSQKSSSKTSKKDNKGATYSNGMEKLKASNFPASVLRIGTWEYKSRYEGDLVAKCYFAKHKLVWEVLDGGLKNKIEIQWSDIMAIKAIYHDDAPGSLSIVLARPPLFYRETNPQPRKHTLWQATSDFTNGQATIHRRHYMHCPQGLLGKHYEKLIQCDPRLNFLSQQPEITLENPYFEPKVAVYNNPSETTSHSFEVKSPAALNYINSPSGIQSSTETLSPSSEDQCKDLEDWNNMIVPGLPNSMSMNDLVNHFEQRISESSSNIILSSEERQSLDVLEDIRRYLFSDATPESDEKRLMARVDSLCCLLQADPVKVENDVVIGKSGETKVDPTICERKDVEKSESGVENKESLSMSRKDSVGDLLMNLPPIASLPSDYAHW